MREQEQGTSATAAGVDEVTDIDVATGDHARERRHDALEALQLPQAFDVGVCGSQIGDCLRVAAALFLQLLLRNGVLLAQALLSFHGAAGEVQTGGGLLSRGDGLRKLLIDFGCLDLGEQLAFFDAGTDVLVPAAKITARPRGNR